jgi:hypothetical protein
MSDEAIEAQPQPDQGAAGHIVATGELEVIKGGVSEPDASGTEDEQ